MPRPCKRRRVCEAPACARFGPVTAARGAPPRVCMTLDEFEAIRLIDWENRTQEQCAAQMNVARTTVQSIYASARRKLAECLVREKELVIEGGDYVLCGGDSAGCCQPCRKRSQPAADWNINQEEHDMRIAVTYENGQVFQHFGHTERFKVYDVDNGQVTVSTVVDTNGSGHGALAGLLQQIHVDTLICGGIGGGAKAALDAAGIKLYGGVSGDADQAVEALLKGTLTFSDEANCDHHEHAHEGGGCGSHGCGEHGCGGHH